MKDFLMAKQIEIVIHTLTPLFKTAEVGDFGTQHHPEKLEGNILNWSPRDHQESQEHPTDLRLEYVQQVYVFDSLDQSGAFVAHRKPPTPKRKAHRKKGKAKGRGARGTK